GGAFGPGGPRGRRGSPRGRGGAPGARSATRVLGGGSPAARHKKAPHAERHAGPWVRCARLVAAVTAAIRADLAHADAVPRDEAAERILPADRPHARVAAADPLLAGRAVVVRPRAATAAPAAAAAHAAAAAPSTE